MDWKAVIDQLGGGPVALALVGLAYAYWQERKRNNDLADKQTTLFLALSKETTAALNALTDAIRAARGGH